MGQGLGSHTGEAGSYYSHHYTMKEYGASAQNWGGVEDSHGIMIFANGDGVLTYDGARWTLIETPTQSVIRSIAVNDSGVVYVGALDDFGYLKQRPDGSMAFESMVSLVKPSLQTMGNIWSLHTNKDLVYFESEIGVFCWNGERMQFWAWPNPIAWHKSFIFNDTLYAQEEGTGLMVLKEGQFVMARGGEAFDKTRIYGAILLANRRVLFATNFKGLFLYDWNHVEPFKTQADVYLKENQIYTSILLPDDTYALGTKRGGIVVIDHQGAIRSMITAAAELPSNTIYGLTLDHNNNLWISSENGISNVELFNHLSTFLQGENLESPPNDICRFENNLYAATNLGLFVLHPASLPNRRAYFERVYNIKSPCWQLLAVDGKLLLASNEGLFELIGNSIHKITSSSCYAIHRYLGEPNRIITANDFGFESFVLRNGKWQPAHSIGNLRLDNVKFNETLPGKLWISTFSQGPTLIDFVQRDGSVDYDMAATQSFGLKDGLPEGFIKINTIGGRELFRVGNANRLYRFKYDTRRFYRDSTFDSHYGLKEGDVFPVASEDESGRFYARTRPRADKTKQLILVSPDTTSALKFDISRIFESVNVITYSEPDGIVWYGGVDGMVRQELSGIKFNESSFSTYINKIILLGDSVFFRGIRDFPQNPTFDYSSNSIRFEFTATNFVAEEANAFQIKLEGYDKSWSDWTEENVKEYAKMWEGEYRFLVRSRNYAGVISKPDAFTFTIAPPWFRSGYAYGAYVFVAAFFVWGVVRWRSFQLIQERETLKREITNRTREITQQNIQLAEQAEELKINAEQLKELDKLKTNFFVNISHEFRTPLSLILSPLEKLMLSEDLTKIRPAELQRMYRNARRLQQLINQLLDLAKLESGGMKINEEQSDFIYFVRVLTASFESLAEIRNIQYTLDVPPNSHVALFDHEKIETVLNNLLSNAFKFTPDGGRIDVSIRFTEDSGQESVGITIADTGPGFPPSEKDKIFDRFYQVDNSSSREFEGSGIGLSLVKELVLLMGGTLDVQTEIGHGTSFQIKLPLKAGFPQVGVSGQEESHDVGQSEDKARLATAIKEENAGLSTLETPATESIVLIIEDNDDLRTYLKENLEDDFQIIVAQNGQIGLDRAMETIPDLILSDMMMPLMDGFTLCTRIREDPRTSHIPFILLTARTTIESKLEGLELGADEYMTKPFNINEIKVRIRNLLTQRRNLRKNWSRELTLQPKSISVTSMDERFLVQALTIMEEHLADMQFSVERFAEEIGMSRKSLLRKIKALTDQSVNEFIRNFRLRRASQLIEGRSGTVSEIAYQVGFNNLSYFSKCFKELFGVLPNEYPGKELMAP